MSDSRNEPVTVGNWMLTFLLLCIPFVNIILIIVWAFGGGAPESKANFFRAWLIWMVIAIAAVLFMVFAMGISLSELAGNAQVN